jgi:hypothetical protein
MATATKKPPKKKAKKRLRQGFLPGMKPPSIKEIDSAAEDYVEARDGRGVAQKEEIKQRDRLLELMKKHSLVRYEYDGKVVEIIHEDKEKVKVNAKKDDDETIVVDRNGDE